MDLINRQDAIAVLSILADKMDSTGKTVMEQAVEVIRDLRSVQKTGKWIIFPPCFEEICMCSNCKTKFKEAYQHRDTCPSCGARMVGEEE